MKTFRQLSEELNRYIKEDDEDDEDSEYHKDGKKFTLHRVGGIHHLIHNGKTIASFGADKKSVHNHLDMHGYKLGANSASNSHFKKGTNWFQEQVSFNK